MPDQQHQPQQQQQPQRRQQRGRALETLSVLQISAFLFGIAKTLQMIIRIQGALTQLSRWHLITPLLFSSLTTSFEDNMELMQFDHF